MRYYALLLNGFIVRFNHHGYYASSELSNEDLTNVHLKSKRSNIIALIEIIKHEQQQLGCDFFCFFRVPKDTPELDFKIMMLEMKTSISTP